MSVIPVAVEPRPIERSTRVRRQALLGPGWPLTVIFLGFPLWWVLGLSVFIFPVMAVPMLWHLVHRPTVHVPKGFGLWLLFLVWMFASSLVLQADAPGAIPGGSLSRYATFAYRAMWYLTVTIALLYVGNLSERELPRRRVARLLAFMFLVTLVGGMLGVLLPHVEFKSLLEIALPGSIAHNPYVNSLIHPSFAQIQQVLGYESPRPSAPFTYTNTWGANLIYYLPFFLLAWGGREAGWRRPLAPVVLAIALIPVVVSLNRGLWIGLGVAVIYGTIRLAMVGRTAAVGLLVGGIVAAVVLILVSPLGEIISLRLQHPNSNQGRENLSGLTVSSAYQGSPIVGFGSTRNVQGNFNSIAGGTGTGCNNCSPPAMGTQGDLWRLTFSYGFIGAGLYLLFFFRQLFRYLPSRSPYVSAGCCTFLTSFVIMFVYDNLGPQLFTIMLALALMWREDLEGPEPSPLLAPRLEEGALA
jgi:hypothetical protein